MSLRAAAQDRTHQALLDSAEAAFFSREWHEVPLTDIAAGAGVTKQTLLRHFGSKDGLLEATLQRGYGRVRAQRFAAPPGDLPGVIDNLLDHYDEFGGQALRIGVGGGDLARRARGLHYEWIDHAFGRWLEADGQGRRRAALIALCDVHTWWLLSSELGLPRAEVRATLLLAISRLLEEDA